MTIESVIREQRAVIERLLAGDWPSERELKPLRDALVEATAALVQRRDEEQAAREHAAERQALDALEKAAQASCEDDPTSGAQSCLDAVRAAFAPGSAAAVLIFDGIGATVVRAFSGQMAEEPVDRMGWEVAHKKEVVEVTPAMAPDTTLLMRSLPLAGERRGAFFLSLPERPSGAVRRLLESIADRLAHALDLHERQHRASDELERLGEERALRERFVATLAHDLRGPLMAARISLECMVGGLHRPDLLQYARRAVQSIGRADGMMRDLLDASRVRAGQPLPLQLGPVDLGLLVREIIDDLTPQYGPRFLVQVESGIHGVWCARELRRAVWNLLMNALRHGAAVRPIVISGAPDGNGVRITVENEGPAIARDALERIFDPYQRRSGDGWGLGLTLVRACAEAHGGTVTVESGEGVPTVFTLRLPVDSRPFYAELLERAEARAGHLAHFEH